MSQIVSLLAEAGNFLVNFKHLVQPNELLFLNNVFSFFSELLRNYRNLPVFTEAFLKETKS